MRACALHLPAQRSSYVLGLVGQLQRLKKYTHVVSPLVISAGCSGFQKGLRYLRLSTTLWDTLVVVVILVETCWLIVV